MKLRPEPISWPPGLLCFVLFYFYDSNQIIYYFVLLSCVGKIWLKIIIGPGSFESCWLREFVGLLWNQSGYDWNGARDATGEKRSRCEWGGLSGGGRSMRTLFWCVRVCECVPSTPESAVAVIYLWLTEFRFFIQQLKIIGSFNCKSNMWTLGCLPFYLPFRGYR